MGYVWDYVYRIGWALIRNIEQCDVFIRYDNKQPKDRGYTNQMRDQRYMTDIEYSHPSYEGNL
jgi:hypothetical protein